MLDWEEPTSKTKLGIYLGTYKNLLDFIKFEGKKMRNRLLIGKKKK